MSLALRFDNSRIGSPFPIAIGFFNSENAIRSWFDLGSDLVSRDFHQLERKRASEIASTLLKCRCNTVDSPLTNRALILECLLVERSGYGATVIDWISSHTDGAVKLSEGTVYPTLSALVQDGLVRPVVVRGGPNRARYFSLTPKGRERAMQNRQLVRLIHKDSLMSIEQKEGIV